MKLNENLEKYASMLLRVGVDLQDGQELLIAAAPEAAALVRKMTECAYKMGAKRVQVMWSDAVCDRLDCEYQSEEELAHVPDWRAEMVNAPARRGCAYVRILSEDPAALAGVDAKRVAIRRKALSTATKESSECRMTGKSPWLVAAYPGAEWALKVFPDDLESKAMDALYTVILQASRADGCDPAAAWATHQKNLTQRVKWLNSQHFDRLHYKNSLGTDFTVGLAKNHVWEGGASLTPDGRSFVPNMPTEEVFTAPDRFSAEGTLAASLPLSHGGALIENFTITFHEGRAVSFTAEKGGEALQSILDTDEGAKYLGEVALIPADSPISRMGLLFYNTLFDENASCHFALGAAYPENVEGGMEMSKEELKEAGLNDSLTHVDFMIGTADLEITGIRADGSEIPVFRRGVWAR